MHNSMLGYHYQSWMWTMKWWLSTTTRQATRLSWVLCALAGKPNSWWWCSCQGASLIACKCSTKIMYSCAKSLIVSQYCILPPKKHHVLQPYAFPWWCCQPCIMNNLFTPEFGACSWLPFPTFPSYWEWNKKKKLARGSNPNVLRGMSGDRGILDPPVHVFVIPHPFTAGIASYMAAAFFSLRSKAATRLPRRQRLYTLPLQFMLWRRGSYDNDDILVISFGCMYN
jgi:hypothetical protein